MALPVAGGMLITFSLRSSVTRSSADAYIQFLFFLRIPFLIFFGFTWFAMVQWTTPGTLLRKANLWCIIGIPGIWWVDLQVDGVRRGQVNRSQQ